MRKTNDVDLAILVQNEDQFKALKKALEKTGHFSQHPKENIKLIYKEAIELDLLPFGDIEQEDRNVSLSDPLFILNMPGFKEIHPSVEDIAVSEDHSVKVCTMEGIILLKLIANDDRPQRTKDISDIEHIISVYFELYDGSIYDEHFDTMDMYDTNEKDYLQLVCARVIGRKIKALLSGSDNLMERVKGILAKRPTAWWNAMLQGMKDFE
ncbi:MAG: nucleotidyl transferase AbiEii/AbiGii toxin family protein [Mucilaginibacter sp.]|nr:nucleotidyl transferase AbiEii/AbiGii toxin family protein [Mucilaginibacter sp.]